MATAMEMKAAQDAAAAAYDASKTTSVEEAVSNLVTRSVAEGEQLAAQPVAEARPVRTPGDVPRSTSSVRGRQPDRPANPVRRPSISREFKNRR